MPTIGNLKYALCPSCNEVVLPEDATKECAICKLKGHTDDRNCIVLVPVPASINLGKEAPICQRCYNMLECIKGFDECVKKTRETYEEMIHMKAKSDKYLQKIEREMRSLNGTPLWGRFLPGVALVVALLLTGYCVWKGWAQKPEVSIQYNVGEIVGGLLVGLGAVIAALSYASKRRNPPERPRDKIDAK